MRRFLPFTAGALVLLTVLIVHQTMKSPHSITPHDAELLLRSDSSVVALDVRTPAEFTGPSGHLRGAIHIPVDDLEERLGELTPYSGRTLIVYCRSGHRSSRAASLLEERGFTTFNLEGGIVEWNSTSLPVIHGSQAE